MTTLYINFANLNSGTNARAAHAAQCRVLHVATGSTPIEHTGTDARFKLTAVPPIAICACTSPCFYVLHTHSQGARSIAAKLSDEHYWTQRLHVRTASRMVDENRLCFLDFNAHGIRISSSVDVRTEY